MYRRYKPDGTVRLIDPAERLADDAALAAQIDALTKCSAAARLLSRMTTSSSIFASLAATDDEQQQQQALSVAHGAASGGVGGYFQTGVNHLFYLAQRLTRAITSSTLFATLAAALQEQLTQTQALYVARDPTSDDVIGYLNIGFLNFHYVRRDGVTTRNKFDGIGVLDMFVSDKYQRQGVGLKLFQMMLATRNKKPVQIVFVRPTPALFAFLRKHFGLESFVEQPHGVVVYDEYFTTADRKLMQSLELA